MPASSTSATLINESPFKGSTIVLQFEDPTHLPCTESDNKTYTVIVNEAWHNKFNLS